MSVNDFLMDFAIASLFIMIGQLIRAKVKLVQKFFVPASMIAGFLALALGSQGLNVLPFSDVSLKYVSPAPDSPCVRFVIMPLSPFNHVRILLLRPVVGFTQSWLDPGTEFWRYSVIIVTCPVYVVAVPLEVSVRHKTGVLFPSPV